MNSSVETRYPFLDEDVFAFLAQLHPVWKMRGLRDKLILRYLAERWLPQIAWRRKAMFRAPLDGFHLTHVPTFVDQLLSPNRFARPATSIRPPSRTGEAPSRNMRGNQRTMVEMGLVGVVATQLWHHTYIDGSLADLPAWTPPGSGDRRSAVGAAPRSLSRTSRAGRLDRPARPGLLRPRP